MTDSNKKEFILEFKPGNLNELSISEMLCYPVNANMEEVIDFIDKLLKEREEQSTKTLDRIAVKLDKLISSLKTDSKPREIEEHLYLFSISISGAFPRDEQILILARTPDEAEKRVIETEKQIADDCNHILGHRLVNVINIIHRF